MTAATEQEIFRKLEAIKDDVGEIKLDLATYIAGAGACKSKCDKSYDAIFGNGKPGLKAKMWIVWGGLGTLGTAVFALLCDVIKGWASK